MKSNLRIDYDFENLNSVQRKIDEKFNSESFLASAYTLMQRNAPCDVVVTDDSRDICASALMRFV